MFTKILVPYDNSDTAKRALGKAVELAAGAPGAQITVLNVVEWQDYNAETFKIASRMSGVVGGSLDMNAISEVGEEAARVERERIAGEIADIVGDTPVEIAVANGSPHDSIVAFASDKQMDVIVMGHRGMGMIRGMIGSVCYSVLQKADRPVLVVK